METVELNKLNYPDVQIWKNFFEVSVEEIFSEFQKNNIGTCKKQLERIEIDISKTGKENDLRKIFYFEFLRIRKDRNVIHFGLNSCELFVQKKISEFFTDCNNNGSCPKLNSEKGQIYALAFSGKIIPLETYHVVVTVVPKFIIPKMKVLDIGRFIPYVIFKMKGFGPVLEFHLPKMDQRLTSDLVFRDYLNVGKILAANKKIKGTYQSNWFLDPTLAEISSHFVEIQNLAGKFGALIISLGEDSHMTSDAIAKSEKRRLLYQQGRYKPKRMVRVWSRSDILKFFENNKDID